MTVKIDLDLNATGIDEKITKIKGELEGLEDLDFDFDSIGDLSDTIDDLSDSLDNMGVKFKKDIKEAVSDLEGAELSPEVADGVRDVSGDGSSDDEGSGRKDRNWREVVRHMGDRAEDIGEQLHRNAMDSYWQKEDRRLGDIGSSRKYRAFKGFDETKKNLKKNYGRSTFKQFGGFDRSSLPDLYGGSSSSSLSRGDSSTAYNLDSTLGKLKKKVNRLIPSMGMFYRVLGAISPVLVTMAVHAGGLAAALGSMAGAGAAVMGLGLIGHGETLAGSMEQAKKQVNELKTELFEVFQPTAQMFASIQAEFFDFIPGQMEKIATSMQGLTAFKSDFFSLFRGGTQFVEEFIQIITGNSDKISQLTHRFSQMIGSGILNFFSFLLNEAYRGQDTFMRLIRIGVMLGETIWNIALFISEVVSSFGWLFSIVSNLSKLLKNDLIADFAQLAAVLGIATYVGFRVAQALTMIARVASISAVPVLGTLYSAMQAYIFQGLTMIGVNYAIAQSIATIATVATLGAAALLGLYAAGQAAQGMEMVNEAKNVGGVGGSRGRGRGRGTTNIINNEGDKYELNVGSNTDNTTVESMKDFTTKKERKESARFISK